MRLALFICNLIEVSSLKKKKEEKKIFDRFHPSSKNLRASIHRFHGRLFRTPFEKYFQSTRTQHVFTFPWGSGLTASIPGLRVLVHLGSGAVYCVEVAESRVISNNTITPNNRVYRTRPAYASGSITFILHHCASRTRPFSTRGGEDWYTLDGSESYVTGNRSDFHRSILFEIVTSLSSFVSIYIYICWELYKILML